MIQHPEREPGRKRRQPGKGVVHAESASGPHRGEAGHQGPLRPFGQAGHQPEGEKDRDRAGHAKLCRQRGDDHGKDHATRRHREPGARAGRKASRRGRRSRSAPRASPAQTSGTAATATPCSCSRSSRSASGSRKKVSAVRASTGAQNTRPVAIGPAGSFRWAPPPPRAARRAARPRAARRPTARAPRSSRSRSAPRRRG